MDPLAIAALGFQPRKGESTIPEGFLGNGWRLQTFSLPCPPDDWLERQQVDLFLLDRGLEERVNLTLRIGRRTGKPVVWIDRLDPEAPRGIWEQVVRKEWPLFGVLPPNAPRWTVVAVCRSLVDASREREAAARRIRELEQKLEDRKVVERAKGILMDRFDLAESEAYQHMRRTSMRQRKSLREIAGAIIAFDEMHGRR